MSRLGRSLVVTITGIAAFVAAYFLVFPSGCADVGGVPSWERCTTPAGIPAFSVTDWGWDNTLDIVIPLSIGVLAGVITWFALIARDAD